jgi:hypothetical protein
MATPRPEPGAHDFAIRGAAKGGVLAYTFHLAAAGAPHGVRANGVLPGVVRSPSVERLRYFEGGEDSLAARVARVNPLGRMCEPEDVARAALFLASDGRRVRHGRRASDRRWGITDPTRRTTDAWALMADARLLASMNLETAEEVFRPTPSFEPAPPVATRYYAQPGFRLREDVDPEEVRFDLGCGTTAVEAGRTASLIPRTLTRHRPTGIVVQPLSQ